MGNPPTIYYVCEGCKRKTQIGTHYTNAHWPLDVRNDYNKVIKDNDCVGWEVKGMSVVKHFGELPPRTDKEVGDGRSNQDDR